MSIFIKKRLNLNNLLLIWETNESIQKLASLVSTKRDLETLSVKRKKEWLTTRILLKEVNPKYKLQYNKFNAPRIVAPQNMNDPYKRISITHNHKFTAIILGSKEVGIDIEEISEKPLRAASKFINLNIHKNINNEEATLIWCAKECLFKIYEKGNINFKNDMRVKPFIAKKKGQLITYLFEKEYKLEYQKIDNHYLVYFCK